MVVILQEIVDGPLIFQEDQNQVSEPDFIFLTSASSIEFGEGSFDKGFYIQIPFNLLQKKYTSSNGNFRLSPLTRDGGAKLNQGKQLEGFIFDSRFNDLYRNKNDFYN